MFVVYLFDYFLKLSPFGKDKKTRSNLFQLIFLIEEIFGKFELILLSKKEIFLPKFFVAHK